MRQLLKAEAKLPTIIVLMNVSLTILVEFVQLAYKIGFHPVSSMQIVFVVKWNGIVKWNSSDHLIGLTLENPSHSVCGAEVIAMIYQDDYSLDSILHNYNFITTRY